MSLTKTLFWLCLIYLTVVFVVTMLTGIAPLWQFGVASMICISLVPLFMWFDKRALGKHSDKVTTDLDGLQDYLRIRDRHWHFITESWIGRQIQITDDVPEAKDLLGKSVRLHRGMVGQIIDLNKDPSAPFRVQFAGYNYPVDVSIQEMELVSSVEPSS